MAQYHTSQGAIAVRRPRDNAVDSPMQTFRGANNFLPHALSAWEERAQAEEARREADIRTDKQGRREEAERERGRRLADRRTSLSGEALAALRHRAEEALAADGVARMRLGYEVLVKLKKVDDLLEQEGVRIPASADGAHSPAAVTARR